MSTWWNSKRLLVLLVGIIATSTWGAEWNGIPVPAPNVYWTGVMAVAYITGQSLVDCAKAWRGGAA